LKQPPVTRSVVPRHQRLDHMNLRAVHDEAEELSEHVLQHLVADAVGDVLEYHPAHQAVEVFGEPLVALGDKDLIASTALMDSRSALDDPSLDPAAGEHEVKGSLSTRHLAL